MITIRLPNIPLVNTRDTVPTYVCMVYNVGYNTNTSMLMCREAGFMNIVGQFISFDLVPSEDVGRESCGRGGGGGGGSKESWGGKHITRCVH